MRPRSSHTGSKVTLVPRVTPIGLILFLLLGTPSILGLTSVELGVSAGVLVVYLLSEKVLARFADRVPSTLRNFGKSAAGFSGERTGLGAGYTPAVAELVALGSLAPLLPATGPHVLSLFLLFLLTRNGAKQLIGNLLWGYPILVVVAAPLAADGLLALLDARHWWLACNDAFQSRAQGFEFLPLLGGLFKAALPSFSATSYAVIMVAAVGFFGERNSQKRVFQISLVGGAMVASLVTLLQFFSLLPFPLQGQTVFWTHINRFSSTFSDPNAHGVFLFFALVLGVFAPVFEYWRGVTQAGRAFRFSWRYVGLLTLFTLCTLMIIASGLLSGSRTFLLGVGLFVLGSSVAGRPRMLAAGIGAVLSLVLALSLLDLLTPALSSLLGAPWMPEGGRRVLSSLSLPRVSESFFSRSVFFQIAYEVIRENAVFGVGIGRFRYFVPAVSENLGLSLGGWVDNSNNFYLGILAEVGFLGVPLLCMALLRRRVREDACRTLVCLGGVGVVLLLTGPHTDFPEVCILYSAVLGFTTCQAGSDELRASPFSRFGVTTLVMTVGGGLILGALERERGVYRWEKEKSAFHQWLNPVARVRLECECDGYRELSLETPPGRGDREISIVAPNGESIARSLVGSGVVKMRVPCASPAAPSTEMLAPQRYFTIRTSPVYIPALTAQRPSSDYRLLGVRLRNRTPDDLLLRGSKRKVCAVVRGE